MPELNEIPKDVATVARDAAYVVVGLGVLGLQRAQVQRQAVQKRIKGTELDDVLTGLRSNVSRSVQEVNDAVEQAIRQIETSIEPLEQQLPAPVRDLVGQAHQQAREVRGEIRHLVEAAV